MRYQKLGLSDLEVSALGLGCNNFGGRLDVEASRAVIHRALDVGVTLFDTADVYPMGVGGRSEEILGDALGARRQEIVLATKFGMSVDAGAAEGGGAPERIKACCEASLRRLKTDWIDLFQYHVPDTETPIEETLSALDNLVQAGKVRYVGCSNFSAAQIQSAHQVAATNDRTSFICSQEEYSLVTRKIDKAVLPALKANGMGLLPFFPLASGLLTGKYQGGGIPDGSRLAGNKGHQTRFLTEANLALATRYINFCEKRGKQLIDLAFSWLLSRPPIASVIAGASTPEQVSDNADATGWVLSDADLAEIDEIYQSVSH